MQNNGISPFDRQLGRKVKEARRMRGMTQDDLGKELGVTYQQIQKNEAGKNRISAERLCRIGKVLKMPLSYLLDVRDEENGRKLFPADTLRLAATIHELPGDMIRKDIMRLVSSINRTWKSRQEN